MSAFNYEWYCQHWEGDPLPESEKERLRNQLRLLWTPVKEFSGDGAPFYWHADLESVDIRVLELSCMLRVYLERGTNCLFYDEIDGLWGHRDFKNPNASSDFELEWERVQQKLVDIWLPTFRQNLWLLGADIEHSAHEAIEWAMYGKKRGVVRNHDCSCWLRWSTTPPTRGEACP